MVLKKLTIAPVIPIFKSSDVTSLNNYKPIAVLPRFSKILARSMYNQLFINFYVKTNYFKKNNLVLKPILQQIMALLNLSTNIIITSMKTNLLYIVYRLNIHTRYTYFQKLRISDFIPWKLPVLSTYGFAINRQYPIKCLGVI